MACSGRAADTRFIFEAGIKLGFCDESIATACVYYHKFYQLMSRDDYNSNLVVMAVLNLAAKAREVPVKLSDVVNTCHRCLHPGEAVLEVGDMYWQLKDSVARYELLLLRVLRFDIYITTPHCYLLHCLLALSRWVEPEAWSRSHVPALSLSLLQDTFHTPLPLSLPPHTLATAALYLAVFCCRLPVPGSVGGVSGRRWWEVFSPESSESDLQDVARQIMTLYDSPAESSGQAEQLPDSHAQPREERGREGTVSVSGKQ